jgi:hypothetical protein
MLCPPRAALRMFRWRACVPIPPMLILKLLLTPLLTLGVSLAARVWGHRVSGWLTALPIIAAPIFAILLIEQPLDFCIRMAIGTLVTLPGLAAYCVAYRWIAHRAGWAVTLVSSWAVFFVVAIPLSWLDVNVHEAAAIAWIGLVAGWLCIPNPRSAARPVHVPRVEIALRVVAAVALMLTITYGAQTFGPRTSGVLLSFPIGASVLPAFTRALHGVDATDHIMRGVIIGLLPFPLFFYGLGFGLPLVHPALAYIAGLGSLLLAHFLFVMALRHRAR